MRLRVAAAALALAACREQAAPAEAEARSELSLLTSLPLVFGEGFALDTPKHPALAALEKSYTVRLVDGPEQLRPGGLLLAVQPQALTAERLVALDRWVRGGGRILLLADPRFTWESSRPLGDRFRPPYAFPDTGLLQHWGLRLTVDDTATGPAPRQLGGQAVPTASPGQLSSVAGACSVTADRLLAHCRVGKGYATVVADADFLQVGTQGGIEGQADISTSALLAELDALKR